MSTSTNLSRPSSGTRTGMSTVGGGTQTGMSTLGGGTQLGISREQLEAQLAEPPRVNEVKGFRLDQLMLLTTVLIVVAIISLLASVYVYSTQAQFEDSADRYKQSLQEQARELGQTVSHTLSLTSAGQLRDNSFGFLGELVAAIEGENANVLRVRIFDHDGRSVADSDASQGLGEQVDRESRRSSVTATYRGQPVFEYQEPIDYGSSAGMGLVVLTYSLEPLQARLRELEQAKRDTIRTTTLRTVGLGLLFLICAAALAAVQSRRITRPLGSLTANVMQLAQGDFEARVETHGKASREVQTLGIVFNHMADRISLLMEDVRSKALLEREMQLARTVQETMLPTSEPFPIGPLRIAGICLTADACGGDWWLRAAVGQTRLVIGVGDVTGHGLSTALVATSATSGFAAAIKMWEPSQVNAQMLITSLNQTMFVLSRGEYQMSTGLAVIDLTTGAIDFAAGAHPPAYIFSREDSKVTSLTARGALLGSSENSQYTSQQGQLKAGDMVVWYTDGLTECRDAQDKMYGNKRLANVMRQYGFLPAEQLRDAIVADIRQFTGDAPQQDDITIVVAEYNPNGPAQA